MSSFQRRFSSLLSPGDSPPTQTSKSATSTLNNLSPDMALFDSSGNSKNIRLSPADRHHQRPVSEILKPENFISPETQVLNEWFEDLQQYESNLESMATASLDPKYKEEIQHVDQWFRYLNEAERTATIYTLLQHSTQVQIRFFIAVLQQMDKKDPVGVLLSPAHPEKVDMQAQLTGAMKKAESEASQKLLSVFPYQTGQVIARPNGNAIRRQQMDRHSFALGDTQEYDHLFSKILGDYSRNPNGTFMKESSNNLQQQQQRGIFDQPVHSTRPKSVIEGNTDLSSVFYNDWSYGGFGQHQHHQPQQQQKQSSVGSNRPKSADISNWSLGITSSVSSKSVRDGIQDPLVSHWSGISPTVATFGERQQQQQNSRTLEMDQQLSMMANNWNLGGSDINSINANKRSSVILSDDTTGFRRRTTAMNRTSIHGTLTETADEHLPKNHAPSMTPVPSNANSSPTNIVLSLYDESTTTPSASTHLFGNGKINSNIKKPEPYYRTQQQQHELPASYKSNSGSLNRVAPAPKQFSFGQFLNPNDRVVTNDPTEAGYYSDHSDASNRSNGSRSDYNKKKSVHYSGNNAVYEGYHNSPVLRNATNVVSSNGGNVLNGNGKDKKNLDVVDMNLLEDVPAWLRSLRLHKYNPIFETLKWQEMLKMDDEALLNRGVAALGARRKLLKVFDQVKVHCDTQVS
ncbi:hypothetical protein [Parasitella parasitica]|uniref:RNA-binding protein VTS1 n=1 Tax=Parasitella parasitica TaxID=35722 RepID=A0A0B7N222_9FUNG|nr:hypothetical protein [Parasitella parasitica]